MQNTEQHQGTGADAPHVCAVAGSDALFISAGDCEGMNITISEWSNEHLGNVPNYFYWDFEDNTLWFENFRSEADALLFKLYWTGRTVCECGRSDCGWCRQ
jgi:hypothetical protein